MPARPPIPNTVRIQVVWAGPNGTKANNIFHALMGSGFVPSVTNLNTIASNTVAALQSGSHGFAYQTTAAWSIVGMNVFDTGGTTENEGSTPVNLSGVATGNALPPQCASVISWTIPAHYRGGHPRTYMPGIPESALTSPGSNEITATFGSNLAAFAQSFLTAFNAALVSSFTETLISEAFFRNNVALTTPTWYPITGGKVHQRLDSQRRRSGKESAFP